MFILKARVDSPQGSAEFLEGHPCAVFVLPPEFGNLFRVDYPEDALLPTLPLDDSILPHTFTLFEKLTYELP